MIIDNENKNYVVEKNLWNEVLVMYDDFEEQLNLNWLKDYYLMVDNQIHSFQAKRNKNK
jgi:hypothetical protein